MNGWGVSTWYTGPVLVPVAETASVFTPLQRCTVLMNNSVCLLEPNPSLLH